ncbi:MAG TPA: helix-turn-helix domain-containing protein [Ktedonobacteraceae bacterium]|nr:helix-turn-helix domain-containing protein [Ktedonobacteraceae bacterium]
MIELNGENYLDGQEASIMLGVKISTLYAYVSRGILRSYKQGIKRQRLYKQAELETLLQLRPSDLDLTQEQDVPARETKSSTPEANFSSQERAEIPHAREWVSDI